MCLKSYINELNLLNTDKIENIREYYKVYRLTKQLELEFRTHI